MISTVTPATRDVKIRSIESKVVSPTHPGHTWIAWKPRIEGTQPPLRGFYPDLGSVPPGVIPPGAIERGDYAWMRSYFFDHSVPGVIRVDIAAKNVYETRHPMKVMQKEFTLDEVQHFRLEFHCGMPKGRTFVQKGRYAFNRRPPGVSEEPTEEWDNCVSWATKTWNQTVADTDRLPLLDPPRVRDIYPLLPNSLSD